MRLKRQSNKEAWWLCCRRSSFFGTTTAIVVNSNEAYILWLLKPEVIETPLYCSTTWSPNKPDYDRLRRVHHYYYSMLLRCLGWRKRKRDDHTLSYADALTKTAFESIEAIVRKRRILFAGFVTRMGKERPPQRVMFGELVLGKGRPATQGGKRKILDGAPEEGGYVGL